MRSIVYAGNDFSDVASAEVVARSANPIIAEHMRVPGRAGALLVSSYIPPVDVTVRLFMDMGYNPGFTGMAQMRAKVRRWLSWPDGHRHADRGRLHYHDHRQERHDYGRRGQGREGRQG